jgi:hypothetical protein
MIAKAWGSDELFSCSMKPGLDGCQRDSEMLCQILHRMLLRYPDTNWGSQFWIEPLDSTMNGQRSLPLITKLFGIESTIRNVEPGAVISETSLLFKGRLWSSPPLANGHQRRVNGNFGQPRRESGSSFKRWKSQICAKKCFLQRILSVFAISGYEQNATIESI